MNYKKAAEEILNEVGGPKNVSSLNHCMTRLRFVVNDEEKVNRKAIEEIEGVLGTAWGAGQFQVIMGGNMLPTFEALMKMDGVNQDSSNQKTEKKEKLTAKQAFQAVVDYMSGSVSPVITGLMAGGLIKLLLYFVSLISPAATESVTYTLITNLANVPFYFMPVLVAYGASRKLGCSPIIPMLVACSLLDPKFMNFEGEASLLGLNVQILNYSTSAIPAMLSTLAVYLFEKGFTKILPGILKNLFAGCLTFLFGYAVTVLWLGPIGTAIGNGVVNAILALNTVAAPLALGVLTAALPFMIIAGVHSLVAPFMLENFSSLGFDPMFRPALLLGLCVCSGAAFGAALRLQGNKKTDAITMGSTALLAGVSEPAIYGIMMKYRSALIGVVSGSLLGGITGGLLGMKAYVMTKNTILALPVFQDTILAAAIACAVAFGTSMAVTALLWKTEPAKKTSNENKKASHFISPVVKGEMVAIDSVNDPTFASKLLGDGVAYIPAANEIMAPVSGTVETVFPTGHAYGIRTADGKEVLIHIGIDTVNTKGEGFTPKVKQGDSVQAGDLLAVVDFERLRKEGYDVTVMLIFPGTENLTDLEFSIEVA